MRALGAQEALNLDGGGSTTMVAGGQILGRPSDTTGERPVGDAVVIPPASSP
jgi:exopolysaccharide biosynthesis protein